MPKQTRNKVKELEMLKKIITQNKFNNKNSTVNIELHLCDIVQQYRVADNDQC